MFVDLMEATLLYSVSRLPAAVAAAVVEMQPHPRKREDPAAAAESYRRAWEQPGGPDFAARLHAELTTAGLDDCVRHKFLLGKGSGRLPPPPDHGKKFSRWRFPFASSGPRRHHGSTL